MHFASSFRLYQILYQRLCEAKYLSYRHANEKVGFGRKKEQPVVKALNLLPKRELCKLTQYYRLNSCVVVDQSSVPYPALLDLAEKLCDGDVDQTLFEEQLRFWFGRRVFRLYTIDKIVRALARQVAQCASEPRCPRLFSLFGRG